MFGSILFAYKLLLASLLKFNTLSLSKGSTSLTQIRSFSITIYACVLRFFFCEAKSFQNSICSFFVKPKWFHAILVVYFFVESLKGFKYLFFWPKYTIWTSTALTGSSVSRNDLLPRNFVKIYGYSRNWCENYVQLDLNTGYDRNWTSSLVNFKILVKWQKKK